MTPEEFFNFSNSVNKKRYDALNAFFVGELSVADAAGKHGYKLSSFYFFLRDFRLYLKENDGEDFFFNKNVLFHATASS
jgi:hypothetical protein